MFAQFHPVEAVHRNIAALQFADDVTDKGTAVAHQNHDIACFNHAATRRQFFLANPSGNRFGDMAGQQGTGVVLRTRCQDGRPFRFWFITFIIQRAEYRPLLDMARVPFAKAGMVNGIAANARTCVVRHEYLIGKIQNGAG